MAEETSNEIPRAQALRLKELINYQASAIVSRTLIDADSGSVTLFSLARKQSLSEHMAPFDAIVLALEGEGEATISGKKLRIREGDIVIMPANRPHALKAIEDFKMLLVMIRK